MHYMGYSGYMGEGHAQKKFFCEKNQPIYWGLLSYNIAND